jgi:flagellar hook assembly protein FlgD
MRTSLTISYAIPSRQRVAVTIYDIAGKKTATVTDQDHRPGYYNQVWNRTDRHGRTAANGVYFVEVRTAADRARKKVVLAR